MGQVLPNADPRPKQPLCVPTAVGKLSPGSRRRNLAVFKNGKLKAIKRGGASNVSDFLGSKSHTEERNNGGRGCVMLPEGPLSAVESTL